MRCLGLEVSMAQQESGFARDGYLHQSPREKRFTTSITLSHPAMGRTDRLFEIIDPARWAIASAQAPGDLELAPKTFGGGNEREALH